jgi:hypothetical protein
MNQRRVAAVWWLGVVFAVAAAMLALVGEVSAPDCEGALLIQADIEQSNAALRAKYVADKQGSDSQWVAGHGPRDARDTGELTKIVGACKAGGNGLATLSKIAIGMGMVALLCWAVALMFLRQLQRESPARFVVRDPVRMPPRRRY